MKKRDLLIITLIYVFSYVVSYFAYFQFDNVILGLFVFDILSTIMVWAFGVVFDNSSIYDPYWSVTPLVMLLILMIDLKLYSVTNIIFIVLFALYSIRLTVNWAITFKDLKVADWRYDMYKNKYPKYWQVINFFGINLMPTLIVFVALLPGIIIIRDSVFGYFSIIGYLLIASGTLIEFFADRTMHKFLKENSNEVCKVGLWCHSRHPNYFGEIIVWIGVFMSLFFANTKYFYLVIGPILVVVLFMTISIPMMEARQLSKRPKYLKYTKETNKLIPWK